MYIYICKYICISFTSPATDYSPKYLDGMK